MQIRRVVVFVFLLAVSILSARSQGVSDYNWIFGTTGNGIRFNIGTDSASATTGNPGMGLGGSAVATDPWTGEILFYTDGNTVYDANNLFMPNGLGINGNPASSQSVAVCAVPGAPGQYYIFTNTATPTSVGELRSSRVNMNQFGNASFPLPPTGDVTSKNTAVAVMPNNLAQGMIIIPNANCDGFWLIAQESGADTYHVLEINAAGLNNITTYTGLVGLPIEAGSMSYHAGTNRLAVAPEDPDNNIVIFTVDPGSGALSLVASVLNSGLTVTGNEAIYDTEWSFNGDFLYYTVIGEAGITADLLQYDVNNASTTLTSVLPGSIFRSYGLKMGADSSIYHLYQQSNGGPYRMGRLSDTDSVAALTIYENSAFGVADYNAKNFPATLPAFDPGVTVGIDISGTCSNVPSLFSPSVFPDADSVLWDFGDGTTSNLFSPVYTYQNGGPYTVNLTTYLDGKETVGTQSINIQQFDLQVNVVQDTVGCKCEFPINSTLPECAGATDFFTVEADIQGGSPTSVLWSNGQTGATLSPDSAGYYYVVVTDISGCSAYAGVNVREYEKQDQRANIWYFGQNAGLDFNTTPPTPLNDSAMNAAEGCSAISDRNGFIIFYTDGVNVYDKNHNQIFTNLGGEQSATQSALIVPFPNDETLFYIFTTEEVYGNGNYQMEYSIFDLKQNNGDGAIISSNNLLFSKSTERIASNNNWLLAHEYGNSTFRAYPITDNGIGSPVISDIGSAHSYNVEENGRGYMKFSQTSKVAVALSDPGNGNYIELFDFVNTTGKLINYKQIDLEENNGQVYGIEFSPGGNKVFATILNGSNNFVEYFIDSIGNPYLRQKTNESGQLGAIQAGPNGQLYVAQNGASSLGTIFVTEDTTMNSNFQSNAQALAGGTTSNLGLPSFVQNVGTALQTPSITVSNLCFGDLSEFVAVGTDIIDEYTWFFGDGGSDTGENVTHTYASPGTYIVSVQITNRCGLNLILTENVVISDIPSPPTVPLTANICSGPITLTAANPADPQFADYTYLWSTGETTNSIQVNQQSIVDVTIFNDAGCTSFAQVLVADNRPQLDLGEDQTVCQDQTVLPLNAGNVGANYTWTINGAGSGNSRFQVVDTTVPGIYDFEVTIIDPLTGCILVEDVTYTVIESPVFVVNVTDSPNCNNNNGSINIDISTTGSYSYFVNGPDFRNDINQTGPLNTINEVGLPIGTYFVTILDEVSGCQVTQSVTINDIGSLMVIPNPTSVPGCGTVSANVDINNGTYDGSLGFNYTLTNLDNAAITNGSAATEPFNTVAVIPGNYTILVEDIATSCTELVGPFVITESIAATLTVTSDECADPVTLTANSNAPNPQYDWTGPNGFTAMGATINPPETGDYNVTVSDLGLAVCPTTEVISVVVEPFDPVINIVGDPCSGSVSLEVEPASGNYSYLWTGPASGGQTLIIGPAESGTYSVRVRNQNTGCEKTSPSIAVTVTDPVSVALSSELACDDGTPFQITATATPGVSYTWRKNGIIVPDSISNTFSSIDGGVFEVEVNNNGCTATETLSVILSPFTEPLLPNRLGICDDPDNPDPDTRQVDLDVGALFVDFQWKRDGVLVSTDPIYTAIEAGNYTVDLLNPFGCAASDTTLIVTECDPLITAPNAFTPNGNGQNEEFFIFSTFVSDDFEIKLFNRWGEMVFQSTDKEFRWNGGYNNQASEILPGGTYVYVIKFVSIYQPERGVQEKRGGVVLLR